MAVDSAQKGQVIRLAFPFLWYTFRPEVAMIKPQTFLLALILAGLAQAQAPQRRASSPKWPPAPYKFEVDTDAFAMIAVEAIRDGVPPIKGKMLVRRMQILYRVPTTDLAEDQAIALLLGASVEEASAIDSVAYSGAAWEKSPKVRYVTAEFYADGRLVATRSMSRLDDRYQLKAERIYQIARALHEKQKPGD
jgi:hypothetical protein